MYVDQPSGCERPSAKRGNQTTLSVSRRHPAPASPETEPPPARRWRATVLATTTAGLCRDQETYPAHDLARSHKKKIFWPCLFCLRVTP